MAMQGSLARVADENWKWYCLSDLASEVIQHHLHHILLVISDSQNYSDSVEGEFDSTSLWGLARF